MSRGLGRRQRKILHALDRSERGWVFLTDVPRGGTRSDYRCTYRTAAALELAGLICCQRVWRTRMRLVLVRDGAAFDPTDAAAWQEPA